MRVSWIRSAATGCAVSVLLAGAVPARAAAVPTEDKLLREKCMACHTSKRAYTIDPTRIKETIERMRGRSPDWISTVESEHIAAVIATITGDPNVMANRLAWQEAVVRGSELFADKALGNKGVACADCHKPAAFRQVTDSYPRWEPKLKRFVDFDETIVLMLRDKIGAEVAPTDQRVMDLLLYLKTL